MNKVKPQRTGNVVSLCSFCSRRNQNGAGCEAYPEEIPQEILWMNVDHRQPYVGDNGVTFKMKDNLDQVQLGLFDEYLKAPAEAELASAAK